MRIDLTSLAFGYTVLSGGATPNWATALGQGSGHRINDDPEINEILKGMIYSAVSLDKISTKIGKGGNLVKGSAADSPIVLASCFSKVFINNTLIENGKFILIITRDTSASHFGRLRLKYGPSITYEESDGEKIANLDLFRMVREQLNLADNACWFVYNISIKDQDTLVLHSIIVDSNGKREYSDNGKLKDEWSELIKQKIGISVSAYGSKYTAEFARNRIFFGAPGTGKSYEMNKERQELLNDSDDINQTDYERVTLHPNYTYSNFVGSYKPVKEGKDITYKYVPGPFMRVYLKALINVKKYEVGAEPLKPYLLLIEEINRANVAAVFGDVFQLLDRNAQGESEYSIQASEDVKKYIKEKLEEYGLPVTEEECEQISLPSNMFIWATMNSADQGVYPMDTAFKRRWEFEYIGIDEKADDDLKAYKIPIQYGTNNEKPIYKYVVWNDLRRDINNILSKDCRVNEDKLLGPYFMTKVMLENALKDEESKKQFIKSFESKVIMYLFEDAVKMHPARIFKGCKPEGLRYSDVCIDFEKIGIDIFGQLETAKVTDNE